MTSRYDSHTQPLEIPARRTSPTARSTPSEEATIAADQSAIVWTLPPIRRTMSRE